MVVYTLATWDVKAGHEAAFVESWGKMGNAFQAMLDSQVTGTLLRRQDQPARFVSFGAWPGAADVARMRADPDCQAAIAATMAHCDAADPGTYSVVSPIEKP